MKTFYWMIPLAVTLGSGQACDCGGNPDPDTFRCTDQDWDGYGWGPDCYGEDCNDQDPTVHDWLQGYPDADGDGEHSAVADRLCVTALPASYALTAGTDCDDNDANAWVEVTGYVDADGDGAGAATAMAETLCTDGTLPAGYAADTSDCNDRDASAVEIVSGYADLDGDGEASETLSDACTDGTLPDDWSDTPGTDCDDYDADAADMSNDPGCWWLGLCLDTNDASGDQADFRGIGGCRSVDCNSADVQIWDPTMTANATDCTSDAELCGSDEVCFDPDPEAATRHCWTLPTGCVSDTEGLRCDDLLSCFDTCELAYPGPIGTMDGTDLAACVQHDCFEAARPEAQHRYAELQQCAMEAGCYAMHPELRPGCEAAACTTELSNCLSDTTP